MIRPRSNISSTLRNKRHASLRKKIFAGCIFVIFFISLIVLGLTTKEVRIKEIKISGNISVSSDDILKEVKNEMDKSYLWIIPTDNLFLLRRNEIRSQIMDKIKEIGNVSIQIHSLDRIEIKVTERESKYLWCKGTPTNINNCYFMDSSGFVFEQAPKFSDNTFSEFFGLITEDNPLGVLYFKNNFKNISNLFSTLNRMSFKPKNFYALNEHEYEIYILGGGKILMNDKKSFESQLTNLQALVDNNYLKIDTNSLKKIKYVDLRFGNKVNFQLY